MVAFWKVHLSDMHACRTGKLFDCPTREESKVRTNHSPFNVLKYTMPCILPLFERGTYCEGRDTLPRGRKL